MGPNLSVIITNSDGSVFYPVNNGCTLTCALDTLSYLSTNTTAYNTYLVNDQNLIEFLICPQFTLPSTACGFGSLGSDNCWHYWGGVVSPPQPPYPVPVNLACLLDQPGDYVFIAQTWNDYPLNGIPDGSAGAQSDTTCISVQDSLSLTTFPVTINPAAPYCTNTPITFSIPNYIAAAAESIQWGVIEPGSTTETMYACSAMSCTTFILNPTMGGIYTVNLYVYFNGTACPGQVEYHMPVEVTDNPCVCIAPQNFLIDPNSSGITNNASTDNRPAYVVGSTAIWTPTNNPFITNYGAISGSDIFLDVDLIIPSGIQLTITGMNIHFAPDRRILVQRGAILNLLGTAENPTALQGACNSMWQGVQVEGPGQNGARVFLPGATTPATYGILNTVFTNIHDAIFGAISTNLPLMNVNTLSAQILSLPTNPIVPSGWGYTPSMVTSLLYNGVLTSTQAFAKAGGMLKIDYDTYFINCLEGVNMPWYKTNCNISPPDEPCECFVRSATFNTSQLAYPFNAGLTAPTKTEAGIHLLNYLPNSSNTNENIMNYEALKKARYYVYDQNNRLAAEGLLEDIQTYLASRMLLNSYLIQGNFEAANQQLANLPNATEEEQQFRQLYQIYSNWRQTGRTLFEITPQEETIIRQIAAASTQTATEARTLLYLRYGEEYPIDLPPLSNLIDPALFENVCINFKGRVANNPYLSAGIIGKPCPNPAKNGFSIDYNLGKGIAATVQFLSITGNIQKTVTLTGSGTFNVAIAEWISGMYYYRITTSNGETFNGKIIVLK